MTIQPGGLSLTRFASPQGTLIPLNPQACVVLYQPVPPHRPARSRRFTIPWRLIE
jgi:hypothetical protein